MKNNVDTVAVLHSREVRDDGCSKPTPLMLSNGGCVLVEVVELLLGVFETCGQERVI
jgi:hypothetical protein